VISGIRFFQPTLKMGLSYHGSFKAQLTAPSLKVLLKSCFIIVEDGQSQSLFLSWTTPLFITPRE
jgi:hypothetical protein